MVADRGGSRQGSDPQKNLIRICSRKKLDPDPTVKKTFGSESKYLKFTHKSFIFLNIVNMIEVLILYHRFDNQNFKEKELFQSHFNSGWSDRIRTFLISGSRPEMIFFKCGSGSDQIICRLISSASDPDYDMYINMLNF